MHINILPTNSAVYFYYHTVGKLTLRNKINGNDLNIKTTR